MKAGLKLNKQFTVAKHNIVQVVTLDDCFQLDLANGECLFIVVEDKYNSGYYTGNFGSCVSSNIPVSINEYHRIQRELSEYFGVEIKNLSDENEEAESQE